MKKIVLLSLLGISISAFAQNVGVGLTTDINARLHVAKADSGLLILDNTSAFADSVKSKLFFRTGGIYAGAIGTHVENAGSQTARMGFFTYALADPTALYERMSIRDNGYVGIGTVAPSALLDVNGSFRLRNNGAAAGRVLTTDANGNATWQPSTLTLPYDGSASATTNPLFIVRNLSASGGAGWFINNGSANTNYALQATNFNGNGGGGFYATANAGTSTVTYGVRGSISGTGTAGYGVHGSAVNAEGVGGESQTGFGVQGIARATGGIGGYFAGFTGANALKTVGGVQLTGIGEGAGKALVSDASGNATWQGAVAFSANSSSLPSWQNIPPDVPTQLNYPSEEFDDGNNYNTANSSFVAPVTGTYHFDASVRLVTGPVSYQILTLRVGNTDTKSSDRPNGGTLTLSCTIKLTAGQVVRLYYEHSNAGSEAVSVTSEKCFFSGYLLR